VSEQRSGDDRRGPGRPKGGRRMTDPIDDLATHRTTLVTVGQLADYWGKHVVTVGRYIREGRLRAALVGGEYRVHKVDAMAFEVVHAANERRLREGV
jgi:excisionase family DNA binding protein